MNLKDKLNIKDYQFLEALQKIISFIKEEENCDDEKISEIIEKYIDIMDDVDREIYQFFSNNDFKVCNLISIFECVEEKCYDNLIENINQKYKENLGPSLKKSIEVLIDKNDRIIKRDHLKTILIKFVIRFLLKNESIEANDNCFEIIQNNNSLYKVYSNENNKNKLAKEIGELSDLNIPVCQVIYLIKTISDIPQSKNKIRKRRNIG